MKACPPNEPSLSRSLEIRHAKPDDLDSLTKIAQAGFPDDPEWTYRFPHRDRFPQDNWLWTRREYQDYLNQPDKYTVLIVTCPIARADGSVRSEPISLGVWDMAVTKESSGSDCGLDERRDANPKHMKHFANTLASANSRYFAHYGDRQIHLWLLATHPDFRRRGAATMICRWGMQRAAEKGWPVTVLASPMGRRLYSSLGFRTIGIVSVQVEDEREELTVVCMEAARHNPAAPGWTSQCKIL